MVFTVLFKPVTHTLYRFTICWKADTFFQPSQQGFPRGLQSSGLYICLCKCIGRASIPQKLGKDLKVVVMLKIYFWSHGSDTVTMLQADVRFLLPCHWDSSALSASCCVNKADFSHWFSSQRDVFRNSADVKTFLPSSELVIVGRKQFFP